MLTNFIKALEHEDSPYFSDAVLLPAIGSGVDLTLITGFVPSYLQRLIEDVATSPEIEPGRIKLLLCIPNNHESDAFDLANALHGSKLSVEQNQSFVVNALKLVDEGGLEIELLVSDRGGLLTYSAIGQLELDAESATFLDRLAGDHNSSLKFSRSWSDGPEKLANESVNQFVVSAKFDSHLGIRRLTSSEATDALREVATANLLAKLEMPDSIDSIDTISQATVSEIEAELEELVELEAELQSEPDDIVAFFDFGESNVRDLTWYLENPEKLNAFQSHAPALAEDIIEVVGNMQGQCWCGNSYDRAFGCPGDD